LRISTLYYLTVRTSPERKKVRTFRYFRALEVLHIMH